jgi:3-oxoacyl-[acyl-carrier protein] reductase
MNEVNRKHVIVTGGSRGLGAAMVKGLLADGYRVSTCSRSKTEAIEQVQSHREFRSRFYWGQCSVADAEQVERFVHDAMTWSGEDGIYGLINNAGIAQAGILATFPNVESEKILTVNLLGCIYVTRAVARHLLRITSAAEPGGPTKRGRIVNVSSIIGTRGYNGLAAYSASKAGMDGLTRALARELGRRNITVNSIAPGYVRTEMSSTLNEAQLNQIVNRTPLGRLPTEQDILGVVRFLLSEDASMITGQTILVDGGISC